MTFLDPQRIIGAAKTLLRQHDYDLNAHATPIGATYAASGLVNTATFTTIGDPTSWVINQGGMYDPSTLTYTIQTPGLYELSGSVFWDGRPAACNHLLLTVDLTRASGGGATEPARWSAPGNVAAAAQGSSGCIHLDLDAGDLIRFKVYQDCGSQITARHMVTCVKFVRPL